MAVPEMVIAAVCSGRSGCAVDEQRDAGQDAAGRKLQVVSVKLPPRPDGCTEDSGREWWALALTAGKVAQVQHLVDTCAGSYGSFGGDDEIEVAPNRFTDRRSGGSTDREVLTETAQLFPPRVISHEEYAYRSTSPESDSTTTWDLSGSAPIGRSSWSVPFCTDSGEPEEGPPTTTGVPVPAAAVDATRLGTCAATADAGAGPLAYGSPGSADDAVLRVAKVGGTLLAEVRDDHLVTKAPKPLFADHLEVWFGDPVTLSDCVGKAPGAAVQWLVWTDGRVEAGKNASGAPPAVTAKVDGGVVRFRIAASRPAFAVAWSDSDDGASQERLVATSSVRFGDWRSLAAPADLPDGWTCASHGGVLDAVPPPPPDPADPLLRL